jgi:cysteine-rich repeat protein
MRLTSIFLAVVFCLAVQSAAATEITASWDGTAGPGACGSACHKLIVDNSGGEEGVFAFDFAGEGHTAQTNLVVSNGSVTDAGAKYTGSNDFTGSALFYVTGPFDDFPGVDRIIAGSSHLDPVLMTGDNTGFSVGQKVFVIEGKDYTILELTVVNNGGSPSDVFVGFTNEWDVNGTGSDDDAAGFDVARSLVFQQDDNDFDSVDEGKDPVSVGMAVIGAPELRYFLGGNGSLSRLLNGAAFQDPYALIEHFLTESKPIEECDDHNTANGDGCSADCRTESPAAVCGDGSVGPGEGCDDSNTTAGDGCSAACLKEDCGDGDFDANEECDDGNTVSGDGCDLFCRAEFRASAGFGSCGDGVINGGASGDQIAPSSVPNTDLESDLAAVFSQVPAGGSVTAAFCLAGGVDSALSGSLANLKTAIDDCRAFYGASIGVCGNGHHNAGESCDDGNLEDGDGCSAACATEVSGGTTGGGTAGGGTTGGGGVTGGGTEGSTTGGNADGAGGGCSLLRSSDA